MNDRHKLLAGLGVAALGIGLAAFSYIRATATPQSDPGVLTPAPAEVVKYFDSLRTELQPTRATLPGILGDFERIAGERAIKAGDSIPARDDLSRAARELIEAMLSGNYETRKRALLSRGRVPDFHPDDQRNFEAAAELTNLASLGIEQMTVTPVFIKGRRVLPDELDAGFNLTTFEPTPALFPAHARLKSSGPTVVEVRFPMQLTSVLDGGAIGEKVTVSMGLRLVWDPKEKKWIPWSFAILRQTEAVFIPAM